MNNYSDSLYQMWIRGGNLIWNENDKKWMTKEEYNKFKENKILIKTKLLLNFSELCKQNYISSYYIKRFNDLKKEYPCVSENDNYLSGSE